MIIEAYIFGYIEEIKEICRFHSKIQAGFDFPSQ